MSTVIIFVRSVGDMYVSINNVNDTIIYKETHDAALEAMQEALDIIGLPSDAAADGVGTVYTFKNGKI